jgi:tetratricopeptide (TPR) repeat protein
LEAVVRKALAKQPADRFQTAAEMRAALGGLAETTPRKISPAPPLPRPRRLRPQPRTIAVIAISLLVLVALAAFLPPLLGPGSAQTALPTAQAHLEAGDYQLAVDTFTTALEADPANVAALLGRARAYEGLFLIDEAVADVEAVIARRPEDGPAYAERARLRLQYQSLDDPETVLADLDQAVDLAPDDARAHFLRGWALLNFPLQGAVPDPHAALDDLRRAAALDPDDAEIQLTLAQALFADEDAAGALLPAQRAVELDSGVVLSWMLRAHIQAVLGDFHAAVDDLTGALEVEDTPTLRATLYAERGYLRWRLGAAAEARADVVAALQADPGSKIARPVQVLVDPEAPPLDPAELERARAAAPHDDPIWQAILEDVPR